MEIIRDRSKFEIPEGFDVGRLVATLYNTPSSVLYSGIITADERREFSTYTTILKNVAIDDVVKGGYILAVDEVGAPVYIYTEGSKFILHSSGERETLPRRIAAGAISLINSKVKGYTVTELRAISSVLGITGEFAGDDITRLGRGKVIRETSKVIGSRLFAFKLSEYYGSLGEEDL